MPVGEMAIKVSLPPLLPHWDDVEPFVVDDVADFRPAAPPTLDSDDYASFKEEFGVWVDARAWEQAQLKNKQVTGSAGGGLIACALATRLTLEPDGLGSNGAQT